MIFDIQRFSLHDGPGIRTTVFFKGCPLRCCWCQNPESVKPGPEIGFYAEKCQCCFLCEAACPEQAVTREPDRRILFSRCTACGQCARVCPNGSIRLIGRSWSVEELIPELMKDRDFFEDSSGGVTLSGGEPMMQSAFLGVLLPRLKESGIHVTLETCGFFKWKHMEGLLPFLDLIYFDLKQMDPASHRDLTGRDNDLILDNFEQLAHAFPGLQARMPIVPGMNDGTENIEATARFLKQNRLDSIHCLPYHNLGEAKIPRIESPLKPLHIDIDPGGGLESAAYLFEQRGIHAVQYD